MITKNRNSCCYILKDGLCHSRGQIDTAVGAAGLIDGSAKGTAPCGIMEADISVKWHPVGHGGSVSFSL